VPYFTVSSYSSKEIVLKEEEKKMVDVDEIVE
jgi:hypothetical protein